MTIEENIKKLNIILPKAADPVGSYVATKICGKLLYISGQISMSDKGELIKGKLGKDLKTEDGYNAAKRCALSIVAQAKKACNDDLSKIGIKPSNVSMSNICTYENKNFCSYRRDYNKAGRMYSIIG